MTTRAELVLPSGYYLLRENMRLLTQEEMNKLNQNPRTNGPTKLYRFGILIGSFTDKQWDEKFGRCKSKRDYRAEFDYGKI